MIYVNNDEPFKIRYANLTDIEAANAIHKAAYPNDPYTYANNIRFDGTINFVAEKENHVVGFITVLINEPNPTGKNLWERMRPYIGFVGVAANSRQIGIGEDLIKEASRFAMHKTNKNLIYLECEIENKKAQKLYEKIGFEVLSDEEIEDKFNRPRHQNSLVYCAKRLNFGL